eukprot:NODE_2205_length_1262_cov_58.935697_g2006_i0.p1 GENE.NODE_2205_length_1262_cov_58.935697_g2006_i0~~NODE_2205_length_1262_cov_58.935697_g2006_i0.p1  ORF type:complete len:263 (+),score=66.19 NODE_2205_length_1262_cov_58.935697_g2006_i0:154-942(+)
MPPNNEGIIPELLAQLEVLEKQHELLRRQHQATLRVSEEHRQALRLAEERLSAFAQEDKRYEATLKNLQQQTARALSDSRQAAVHSSLVETESCIQHVAEALCRSVSEQEAKVGELLQSIAVKALYWRSVLEKMGNRQTHLISRLVAMKEENGRCREREEIAQKRVEELQFETLSARKQHAEELQELQKQMAAQHRQFVQDLNEEQLKHDQQVMMMSAKMASKTFPEQALEVYRSKLQKANFEKQQLEKELNLMKSNHGRSL